MSKRNASDSADPPRAKKPKVDPEVLKDWLHKRNFLRKQLRKFDIKELDLSVPFEERFEEQAQAARLVLKYERLLHEAGYFKERPDVVVWPCVVICGTGTEPLNRLLTKFINTPQVDHGGGFMDQIRFPEKSDVLYMLNKREVRECPLLLDVVEKVGGKNANALDWYAAVVAMEARNPEWAEYRKFLDARQEVAVFPSSSEFSYSTRTSVESSSTSSQQSGRSSVGVRSRSGSAAPSDASQPSEAEVGVRSRSGSAALQQVSLQSEAKAQASMAKLDDFCFEYVKKLADVASLDVCPTGESAVVLADVAANESTDDDKWERFPASLPSDSDDECCAAEPSTPPSAIATAAPSPSNGHMLNATVESGSSERSGDFVLTDIAASEPTDDDKWERFSASLPRESDDDIGAAAALEASTATQEWEAIYREFFELVQPLGQDENAHPKKDEVKAGDPGSKGTKLSSELNAREVPNCVL
ncbi:hypothetical protein AAVH_20197 [Aphelenchoides avenae]|nr:hypothetical protein AAVH_20197 [Aphelenchus avenae]